MGSQVTRDQAFPTNYIKGADWIYAPGCGGKGGTPCPVPTTYSYIWWTIRPSKFAVRNRHLILQNLTFGAFTDAGPDPYGTGCNSSDGVQQGYTLYLLYGLPSDNNFAAHATASKVIPASQSLPFYLNFDSPNLLPQQNSPNWTGLIYVVLDLGKTGLLTGVPQNYEAMATVNLDFDQRV